MLGQSHARGACDIPWADLMNQFFCWYLVWAPLAFITAPILLGLLSMTFLQTSLGVLSHSTSTCPQNSSTPVGGAHRHWAATWGVATHIQMGWGWVTAGHFKVMSLIYWNHFEAFLKVALGSLSCWKVSWGLSSQQNSTIARNSTWRMLVCSSASILLSIVHVWSTPWAGAQPPTIKNLPLKLTIHWSDCASGQTQVFPCPGPPIWPHPINISLMWPIHPAQVLQSPVLVLQHSPANEPLKEVAWSSLWQS